MSPCTKVVSNMSPRQKSDGNMHRDVLRDILKNKFFFS